MSKNKPPFKALTGNFTWGLTQEETEWWTFTDGVWSIETLPPQESAYFAMSVGGRVYRPFIRLSDVQAYQEWQPIQRIQPDKDEWWFVE